MGNIFEIEQTYLRLINEIEEAEGEITPEIQAQLAITEEDFAQKMNSYQRIITSKLGEINVYNLEISRLSNLVMSRKNLIDRLKKVMIEALNLMGDTGKSGNKTLRTNLYNFYTINKKSVEIDDSELNFKNKELLKYSTIKHDISVSIDKFYQLQEEFPELFSEDKATIQPNKKSLLDALQKLEADKGTLLEDETIKDIPGVTIKSSTSINAK